MTLLRKGCTAEDCSRMTFMLLDSLLGWYVSIESTQSGRAEHAIYTRKLLYISWHFPSQLLPSSRPHRYSIIRFIMFNMQVFVLNWPFHYVEVTKMINVNPSHLIKTPKGKMFHQTYVLPNVLAIMYFTLLYSPTEFHGQHTTWKIKTYKINWS